MDWPLAAAFDLNRGSLPPEHNFLYQCTPHRRPQYLEIFYERFQTSSKEHFTKSASTHSHSSQQICLLHRGGHLSVSPLSYYNSNLVALLLQSWADHLGLHESTINVCACCNSFQLLSSRQLTGSSYILLCQAIGRVLYPLRPRSCKHYPDFYTPRTFGILALRGSTRSTSNMPLLRFIYIHKEG